MRVACGQCGAIYEFEASEVPPEGYDAECVHCQGVFFVAPQEPSSDSSAEASSVSIACNHCGAIYQFDASDIPTEGYDAECVECHEVFFVDAQRVNQPSPSDAPPASAVAQAESDNLFGALASEGLASLEDLSGLKDLEGTTLGVESSDLPPPLLQSPAVKTWSPPNDVSDIALAISSSVDAEAQARRVLSTIPLSAFRKDDLGLKPVSIPPADPVFPSGVRDRLPERRPLPPIPKARRLPRRFLALLGAGFAVLLLSYAGLTYFFAPRWFDVTLGRLVGIQRTVDPAAIPSLNRGLALMLEDTDEGYTRARREFENALSIDANFHEARALAGLTDVLRGSDKQARGRILLEKANAATAEIKSLEDAARERASALTPNVDTPDFDGHVKWSKSDVGLDLPTASKIEALRVDAKSQSEAASQMFEQGGRLLSAGSLLIRQALAARPNRPLILQVAALHYTVDPDSIAKAAKMVERSLDVRDNPRTEIVVDSPSPYWVPYIRGLVLGDVFDTRAAARQAFETAVKQEPRFQRARVALAEVLADLGQKDEARTMLEQTVEQSSQHELAKLMLQNLEVK